MRRRTFARDIPNNAGSDFPLTKSGTIAILAVSAATRHLPLRPCQQRFLQLRKILFPDFGRPCANAIIKFDRALQQGCLKCWDRKNIIVPHLGERDSTSIRLGLKSLWFKTKRQG